MSDIHSKPGNRVLNSLHIPSIEDVIRQASLTSFKSLTEPRQANLGKDGSTDSWNPSNNNSAPIISQSQELRWRQNESLGDNVSVVSNTQPKFDDALQNYRHKEIIGQIQIVINFLLERQSNDKNLMIEILSSRRNQEDEHLKTLKTLEVIENKLSSFENALGCLRDKICEDTKSMSTKILDSSMNLNQQLLDSLGDSKSSTANKLHSMLLSHEKKMISVLTDFERNLTQDSTSIITSNPKSSMCTTYQEQTVDGNNQEEYISMTEYLKNKRKRRISTSPSRYYIDHSRRKKQVVTDRMQTRALTKSKHSIQSHQADQMDRGNNTTITLSGINHHQNTIHLYQKSLERDSLTTNNEDRVNTIIQRNIVILKSQEPSSTDQSVDAFEEIMFIDDKSISSSSSSRRIYTSTSNNNNVNSSDNHSNKVRLRESQCEYTKRILPITYHPRGNDIYPCNQNSYPLLSTSQSYSASTSSSSSSCCGMKRQSQQSHNVLTAPPRTSSHIYGDNCRRDPSKDGDDDDDDRCDASQDYESPVNKPSQSEQVQLSAEHEDSGSETCLEYYDNIHEDNDNNNNNNNNGGGGFRTYKQHLSTMNNSTSNKAPNMAVNNLRTVVARSNECLNYESSRGDIPQRQPYSSYAYSEQQTRESHRPSDNQAQISLGRDYQKSGNHENYPYRASASISTATATAAVTSGKKADLKLVKNTRYCETTRRDNHQQAFSQPLKERRIAVSVSKASGWNDCDG